VTRESHRSDINFYCTLKTTISGIDSMEVLNQNLKIAVDFKPLAAAELQALRDQCRIVAERRTLRTIQNVH
jgi:hypothetical protein